MQYIRTKVSQKKVRYVDDNGFDLDLTYITDRIIAMGYPAVGVESIYRNPRLGKHGVVSYLDQTHNDHYMVFNVCAEKSYQYEKSVFHGRVCNMPFFDHNPCPLFLIARFCMECKAWLSLHSLNVVVIHCKAGKGRTGFFISCLLLYLGLETSAASAISSFTRMRTSNGRALNQPSQVIYVKYWQVIVDLTNKIEKRKGRQKDRSSSARQSTLLSPLSGSICLPNPSLCARYLKSIRIVNPVEKYDRIKLVLHMSGVGKKIWVGKTSVRPSGNFSTDLGVKFNGDMRLTIFNRSSTQLRRNKKRLLLARFWFNTFFVPPSNEIRVKKDWIDVANAADEGLGLFGPDTELVLEFADVRDVDTGMLVASPSHKSTPRALTPLPEDDNEQYAPLPAAFVDSINMFCTPISEDEESDDEVAEQPDVSHSRSRTSLPPQDFGMFNVSAAPMIVKRRQAPIPTPEEIEMETNMDDMFVGPTAKRILREEGMDLMKVTQMSGVAVLHTEDFAQKMYTVKEVEAMVEKYKKDIDVLAQQMDEEEQRILRKKKKVKKKIIAECKNIKKVSALESEKSTNPISGETHLLVWFSVKSDKRKWLTYKTIEEIKQMANQVKTNNPKVSVSLPPLVSTSSDKVERGQLGLLSFYFMHLIKEKVPEAQLFLMDPHDRKAEKKAMRLTRRVSLSLKKQGKSGIDLDDVDKLTTMLEEEKTEEKDEMKDSFVSFSSLWAAVGVAPSPSGSDSASPNPWHPRDANPRLSDDYDAYYKAIHNSLCLVPVEEGTRVGKEAGAGGEKGEGNDDDGGSDGENESEESDGEKQTPLPEAVRRLSSMNVDGMRVSLLRLRTGYEYNFEEDGESDDDEGKSGSDSSDIDDGSEASDSEEEELRKRIASMVQEEAEAESRDERNESAKDQGKEEKSGEGETGDNQNGEKGENTGETGGPKESQYSPAIEEETVTPTKPEVKPEPEPKGETEEETEGSSKKTNLSIETGDDGDDKNSIVESSDSKPTGQDSNVSPKSVTHPPPALFKRKSSLFLPDGRRCPTTPLSVWWVPRVITITVGCINLPKVDGLPLTPMCILYVQNRLGWFIRVASTESAKDPVNPSFLSHLVLDMDVYKASSSRERPRHRRSCTRIMVDPSDVVIKLNLYDYLGDKILDSDRMGTVVTSLGQILGPGLGDAMKSGSSHSHTTMFDLINERDEEVDGLFRKNESKLWITVDVDTK